MNARAAERKDPASVVWDVADVLGELQVAFDAWYAEGGAGPDVLGDEGDVFLHLSERLRDARIPPGPAITSTIADTLRPLVAAGDAQAAAGTGEHVGVHIATLRRLLALAEGKVEP